MAKKKKPSAASIFFSFFLKAIVIILGLVILAMGAYLVKQIMTQKSTDKEDVDVETAFEDDNQVDELMMSTDSDALLFETEESQDGSGTVEIGFDELIVVLNATDTAGLAGAWRDKLAAEGFSNIQVGDYTAGDLDTSKIVVTEEGIGGNLKNYLPDAPIETGSSSDISCDVTADGIRAYIIIGKSDDIVSQ